MHWISFTAARAAQDDAPDCAQRPCGVYDCARHLVRRARRFGLISFNNVFWVRSRWVAVGRGVPSSSAFVCLLRLFRSSHFQSFLAENLMKTPYKCKDRMVELRNRKRPLRMHPGCTDLLLKEKVPRKAEGAKRRFPKLRII